MALQITETQGMFSVYGILNSANANNLNRHMQRFINPSNPVILNLEKLKSIDSSAAIVLKQMYQKAMRESSILSIIGTTNDAILPVLKETKTSFILSDDRI